MQVLTVVLGIILIVYCLIYLFLLFKLKNPFKNLVINAIIGIVALLIIYFIRRVLGFFIPINQWTVLASAAGGLPAVCGILIIRILL